VQVPFRLVDVFAGRPLAGNQLCVVPDPVDLADDTRQALALEIGFSETTFVSQAGGDRYAMRIFTPGSELPFAGHPSLGTAYVLVSEGRVTSPVTQSVTAGESLVDVDAAGHFARMRQLPATFEPPLGARDELAAAVGLQPKDLHAEWPAQTVSTGGAHLMLPARDFEAVESAVPDAVRLHPLLQDAGAGGVYVFSAEGGHAKARMFAPDVGITEDPATGSAAGPLGAYLAEHGLLPSGHLTISQGEEVGRPSTLLVDVERDGSTWAVFVGGGVFVVGSGEFVLTD
jgi:trans-2,3-dihydro-3-hydroxyanthranilate isomerase